MEASALVDEACRSSGLDDFGDPSWREGLDVLVASLENEARLNPLGREVLADQIGKFLVNRLRVVAWHRVNPEARLRPVERPVFVIGLPRTATTLLLNLLGQDPAHRCLRRWEARNSVPPPDPATVDDDPRRAAQRKADDELHGLAPGLKALHHEEADGPTECLAVLAQDFRSGLWEVMANVGAYHEWMARARHSSAYAYHRSVLQALQWRTPGRWVLKSPQHCWSLDALVSEYPDARIVMTHRDPVAAVASTCSLVGAFSGLYSDADHRPHIAEQWPAALAEAMDRVADFRTRHGDAAFCDVAFDDLVADPIGEVRRIYAHLGGELGSEVEATMATWLAANANGRHGPHRYAARDLGLDPAEVGRLFARYRRRYVEGA